MKITLSILLTVLTTNAIAQFFIEVGEIKIPLTIQYYSIECVESEDTDYMLCYHVDPVGEDSFPSYPSYIDRDTIIDTRPYTGRQLYEDLETGEIVYSNNFIIDSVIIGDIFLGPIGKNTLIDLLEKRSKLSFSDRPLFHCNLESIFITDTMNVTVTTPDEWLNLRLQIERLNSTDYFGLLAIDCDETIDGWELRTRGIMWKIE